MTLHDEDGKRWFVRRIAAFEVLAETISPDEEESLLVIERHDGAKFRIWARIERHEDADAA